MIESKSNEPRLKLKLVNYRSCFACYDYIKWNESGLLEASVLNGDFCTRMLTNNLRGNLLYRCFLTTNCIDNSN